MENQFPLPEKFVFLFYFILLLFFNFIYWVELKISFLSHKVHVSFYYLI